jgi:hypothetical protein
MKAAAAIAAIGLLAATALGAQGRGATSGTAQAGQELARGPGGQGDLGRGMMGGRMGGGPGSDVPGWENLKKLDKALTVDTAKERVASALKDWGYAELAVDAVTEYQGGFYAVVKDKASGKAALEVLVDATYGTVSASLDGGMNWNTKYGRTLAWPLASGTTITADEAKKAAEQVLARSRDTTKYDLKVVELPGYFSVQLLNGGKLSGLIAVNAYTSQVWYRGGRGGRFAAADESDAG